MTKNQAIQDAHHWKDRAEAAEKALADCTASHMRTNMKLAEAEQDAELLDWLIDQLNSAEDIDDLWDLCPGKADDVHEEFRAAIRAARGKSEKPTCKESLPVVARGATCESCEGTGTCGFGSFESHCATCDGTGRATCGTCGRTKLPTPKPEPPNGIWAAKEAAAREKSK